MKPDIHWLVLQGAVGASSTAMLGPKAVPYPFKPLGFSCHRSAVCRGGLYLAEEPMFNAQGHLEAQFGGDGRLVVVPTEAQKILPAHRKFKLALTEDAGAGATVYFAIFGLIYKGLADADIPSQPAGRLKWLILQSALTANQSLPVSATLPFPFMPVAIGAVDQAAAGIKVSLEINNRAFMNQAMHLDGLFGKKGRMLPVPRAARSLYPGGTVFSAVCTELAGGSNRVTVSLLGVEFPT